MVGVPDMLGRVPAWGMVGVSDMVGVPGMVGVPDMVGIPVLPVLVIPEVLPELVLQLDISLLLQMGNNEIQSRSLHLRQKILRQHCRLHGRL